MTHEFVYSLNMFVNHLGILVFFFEVNVQIVAHFPLPFLAGHYCMISVLVCSWLFRLHVFTLFLFSSRLISSFISLWSEEMLEVKKKSTWTTPQASGLCNPTLSLLQRPACPVSNTNVWLVLDKAGACFWEQELWGVACSDANSCVAFKMSGTQVFTKLVSRGVVKQQVLMRSSLQPVCWQISVCILSWVDSRVL